MPDLSPFERVFNPPSPGDTPSLFGAIGGALGNQSNAERAGDANAEAIQELSRIVATGVPPQQALLQYLQTPEGADVLARGGIKDLGQQFRQSLEVTPSVSSIGPGQTPVISTPGQPPQIASQPTMTTEQATARTVPPTIGVAPGQSVLQLGQGQNGQPGSFAPVFRNPTTATQDFAGMQDFAKLPPDVLAGLAKAQMTPPDQRDTELKRVADDAVKGGRIDQTTADKLRMGYYGGNGAIRLIPLYNRVGDEIGQTVIDLASNKSMNVGYQGLPQPGQAAAPAGSPAAMTQPGVGQPQPGLQPGGQQGAPQVGSDKRLMFFGSGMAPSLLNTYGQIVRNISLSIPTAGSDEAAANLRNLNFLQSSLVQLSRAGEGLNIPNKVITVAQSMGPGSSIWEDPKTSVAHAIDLYATLDTARHSDTQKLNDPQVSKVEKREAEKRIQTYEQVMQNMPSLQEMTSLQKDIASNGPITQQNAVTPGSLVRSGIQGAKGAISEGQRQLQDVQANPNPTNPAQPAAPAQPAQAVTNRFQALSDQSFLNVDPTKLPVPLQQQYRDDLMRRRQLRQPKGQAQ